MAYKFQLGSSIMSGALTQEGALTVNDESGVTQAQISQAGAIAGGSLSGSGDLNIVGTSNFGPANNATISAAGAFAGASLSGSGDLNVVGTSNFGPANNAVISAAGVFSGTGLSSSATLNVAGETKLGAGNQLTVSPAGVLSSSATPTFNSLTADQITINGSLTVNGTTTTVNTTTLEITDKNIQIAAGATGNGARGAGIDIELDGTGSKGFIRVGSNDDTIFELQAPGNSNVLTIDMDAAGEIEFGAAKKLTVSGDFTIDADISSTAAEINMLDAGTAGSSLVLQAGDSIIIGDSDNSNETKKALVSDLKNYTSGLDVYSLSGSGDHAGIIGSVSGSGFYYHAAAAEEVGELAHHSKYFISGSGWSSGTQLRIKAPNMSANGKISIFVQSSSLGDFIHDVDGERGGASGSLLSELGLDPADQPALVLESSNGAVTLVLWSVLNEGGSIEYSWAIM